MLAETPETQRSPCYSAVSASLMNQIVLIICHFATPTTSFSGSILNCCTAESSRELISSEEYRSALRKLNNKQRQVVMFLLLFKLSSQLLFLFSLFSLFLYPFSILSLLPFSIHSLLLFLNSPSLSTIPSFSSDQFSVLLRQRLQVSFS